MLGKINEIFVILAYAFTFLSHSINSSRFKFVYVDK